MADPIERSIPAAPAPGPGADDPAYRPLSLVAIAGFALACLYGLFLLVCAAVAVYRGTPLLMSSGTLLFPAVALLLSFLGYLEVKRSEGTRAGSAFAVWGMTASALCGLAYIAYATGSYLAVRHAADREIRQYLSHLQRGETDAAFRLTLQPGERPSPGEGLHAELEQRKNLEVSDPTMRGSLTLFEQSVLTRRLKQAGPEASIRTGGVHQWEYLDAGYKVSINYQLISSDGTMEFVVTAHGRESSRGQGRQWTIVQGETGASSQMAFTPRGKQLEELRQASSNFLSNWLSQMGAAKAEEAFLETLEPQRRDKVRTEFNARVAAMALTPGPVPLPPDPEARRLLLLPGYTEFRKGAMVSLAPDFWAPPSVKPEVLPEMQRLFGASGDPIVLMQGSEMQAMPLTKIDGDRLMLRHDYVFRFVPRFMVEATLVSETSATAAEPGAVTPTFRLKAIELQRAKSIPTGPPGPRG